ncbi:MAG: hypothetical protein N2169_01210 [bacterium]|nr:hypothetical protein [bacterium]
MKVLFLSNGYGEDTIASYIIKSFPREFLRNISVFPLVTEGNVFRDEGIDIEGPVKVFPSRGISGFLNLRNFIRDLQAGLMFHIWEQIKYLNNLDSSTYFVAVGDIYPLILLYFSKRIHRTFFVATAKSVKTEYFNPFEIFLMKKVIANFVRDQSTMDWILRRYGLSNVHFLGNPVLDIPFCYFESVDNLDKNIIFLPGRVDQALKNLAIFLPAMKKLVLDGFSFTIVIPKFYPVNEVYSLVKGIDRIFVIDSIYYRFFLERSFLVWGFGGSANEQAAGFGLPVISLNENTWYRKRQKKLLGDSLILVRTVDDFISKTLELEKNVNYYNYLRNVGKYQMGGLGGALNISNFIIQKVL